MLCPAARRFCAYQMGNGIQPYQNVYVSFIILIYS